MKRKETVYKGLQFVPVWYEDKSLTSPNFFQITEFPTRLTSGKNLFKFRGHPSNLHIGSYVNIEITDFNGDPIYCEVLNYIDDDKSRVISIYIYNETSPGDCTVTLIAEAENVPAEWKGKPNIKWTRTVPVNPSVPNISEIIFENTPTLSVTEQIGPVLDRIYSGSVQYPTYNTGTVKYYSYNNQPVIEITGGEFTSDMVNGTITVSAPVNPTPTPQYSPSTTSYTGKIVKILNTASALLDTEFVVYSSQSISSHTYQSFDASTFSISYEATPTYRVTENSQSYAIVELNNLEPDTGDIARVKLFTNSNGTIGTWEMINDVALEATEIFVTSTSSVEPYKSIGSFTSQSIINTYWEIHTYSGKTELIDGPPFAKLTWTTSSLNNAMSINDVNDITAKNRITIARVKSNYAATFYKDTQYKITLDALGTVTGSGDAVMSLYLSGSAINYDPTDYFNQTFSAVLGKRLGELRVSTTKKRFDDSEFSFTVDNTGTAVLILVVENGDWQVSDIRTTTDTDSGFTPNYTRIRTIVPTSHKSNNQLSFKAEYYNINGERSKQISYTYNKAWTGGNRYLDGDFSLLTGSMYIGNSLNSGISLTGASGSGYIKSLGYTGFEDGNPGFLMWSGSALSGSSTTYTGAGLELYANSDNYLRFRTSASELNLRTKTFYLGSTASYISGSADGNLEISSSIFHLNTSSSNITASAIVVNSGSIKLFDSINRFIDATNIGRVVYFNQTEQTFDVSTITSVPTAATASVFQTFILPGETSMQMAFTWRHINTDTNTNTIRYQVYIQSASISANDGTAYGTFSTPAMLTMETNTLVSTAAGATNSGLYSENIAVVPDILTDYQGHYVQIYVVVYCQSTTPQGELKMKNFVFRTSRELGNSVNDTMYPPIA